MAHASATLAQPNFRVRSDDSQTINADAGWAAALNTNVTMDAGKRFRIRFEVEETAGANSNTAHKLQGRHQPDGGSFGSWTDIPDFPTASEDANFPVWAITSGQYTDGAATTNVLSGSSAAFVAGDGNENRTTASVSLNNEHTEFEFCLLLKGFWGGPNRLGTNDVIEFRMVESGGTVYAGTYTIPQITVNMPAGYIGSPTVESPTNIGPFIDEGNLYYFVEPVGSTGAGNNELEVIKSTDGGDTWSMVDTANSPTENDIEALDVFQDGDTLHLSIQDGSSARDVTYHTFRTSSHATNPDTWGVADESVRTAANSGDQATAIFQRTGDNTQVCLYRYNDGTNERVGYKIRTSGTWGSENNLDNTASTNFTFSWAVMGASDKIHIFYKDATNGDLYHKSLNSSNTLSSRELVDGDAGTDADGWAAAGAVYWDDTGAEKILVIYQDASDSLLYSVLITNDGSPATRKAVTAAAVQNSPTGTTSEQPTADVRVDAATDTAYVLFVNNSDRDIYRDEAVNDGGWGTDTVVLANKSVDYVRGNIFTHSSGNGGAKVFGYVYDEGAGESGFSWYDEYQIAAAVTGKPQPIILAIAPEIPVRRINF